MKPIMTFVLTGIVLFLSTEVFAQTATDLTCTGCVGSTDIAANGVAATNIGSNAVTSAKIANSAVTTLKISDGTIISADLADSAVTGAKISDGAITNSDIADATITAAKINSAGLNADSIDNIDSSQFLQNGQDGTIGGLTVTSGNITSATAGDICIGTCD